MSSFMQNTCGNDEIKRSIRKIRMLGVLLREVHANTEVLGTAMAISQTRRSCVDAPNLSLGKAFFQSDR